MRFLGSIYEGFRKAEEWIVSAFISVVVVLILASAIGRALEHPLNWATDLSLLLMAWIVFLGADLALGTVGFIRVDILFARLPRLVQWALHYLFTLMAIGMLLVVVVYGFDLTFSNVDRLYQTLGISYAWAALSAPVGAILLILTLVRKAIVERHEKFVPAEGQEAI